MDALTLITLTLFVLMVLAWAILPSTPEEASQVEADTLAGVAAPAASAQ